MGFSEAIRSFFTRYADFQGRSSRSEFWWVSLVYAAGYIVLIGPALLLEPDGDGPVTLVTGGIGVVILLGAFVPALALQIRRLHDSDNSGWMFLLGLLPFIGTLIMLVFNILPGTQGPNRFGPDPLGSVADSFA